MKPHITLTLVVVAITFAACRSPDPRSSPSQSQSPEPIPESIPSPEPIPEPSPKPEPEPEQTPTPTPPPHPPPTSPPTPATPPLLLVAESAVSGATRELPVPLESSNTGHDLALDFEHAGLRFTVLRFEPRILLKESIVPQDPRRAGFPALHVVLGRGTGRSAAWLVPGGPVLGRSISALALLECLPERSGIQLVALESRHRELATPGPKLLVDLRWSGERLVLPVTPGEELAIPAPGYRIRAGRLFRNFAMDIGGQPKDARGQRPSNPALEVVIDHAGSTRRTWLFSRLPEFSRGAADSVARLRFFLPEAQAATDRVDLTLVDSSSASFTIFALAGGRFQRVTLAPLQTATVGDLEIFVPVRLPHARIEQSIQDGPGGREAVLVSWAPASDDSGTLPPEERWVPLDVPQEIAGREETVVLRLARSTEEGAASPHSRGR